MGWTLEIKRISKREEEAQYLFGGGGRDGNKKFKRREAGIIRSSW